MNKLVLLLGFILIIDHCYCQDTSKISLGISGTYYYTVHEGIIIGVSGKTDYYLSGTNALCGIIRKGIGTTGYGAVEHILEWDDDIKSLTEITFLYLHGLSEISEGLFIGSGLSYSFGKRGNNTQYSYLCLPVTLSNEFRLIERLWLNIDFISNINKKTIFWGFDIGVSLKF